MTAVSGLGEPAAAAGSRRPVTLGEALARAAADGTGGLRFVDRREEAVFSPWHELHEAALRVGGALAALGVERGERVALIFPTGSGFFAALFGILAAGAVPVPLYPPVRLGRLAEYHRRTARMIELVGAQLVLADRRIRRILGETVERARPALGCRTLAELPAAAPLAAAVAVDPAELALVQYSSGTTVEPKPVALSHRAVLAQVEILNAGWPRDAGVRPSGASWLPLYHDMGLIGCVFAALELPTDLTLIPPEAFVARPAIWLRTISRYRATVSPAPNFAYGLCVTKIRDDELAGVDLSSWRVALNGAEAVAPSVLRAFRDRFARWGFPAAALTPVYGLSEAALAVTFSDLGSPFVTGRFNRDALARERVARGEPDGLEIVSVGRLLFGFELKILREEDEPVGGDSSAAGGLISAAPSLAAGRVGRVWVRGPSLMEGYLGRPRATARALRDGWLDTGDLGFLHAGELYLTGRAKDVVILRGRNYAPEEIEHAVAGVAGVRPGCVVASSWLAEGAGAEMLMLFVERSREATAEGAAALPAACSEAVLAETGLVPDRVVVLGPGTLPRTSSGKLRRQETLRQHLAGELAPPALVTALRVVGALARLGLAYARVMAGVGRGAGGEGDE